MKRDLGEFLEEFRSSPAFTVEELLQIYEHSGRSTAETALRAAAAELFPGSQAPLYYTAGGFRAFDMGDGTVEQPVATLGSFLCRSVGILKNGEARPY